YMTPMDQPVPPRVSVIIVSWNALELLKQFLPGVVASNYPDIEVILADNASDDGSDEWVREHLPTVRIVRHDKNYAFCGGNNRAYHYATGEFVVFLNNDVEVDPDWLWPLVHLMQSDPDVAAVQPKVLSFHERDRFEHAGAAGGFMDRHGYPFARGRIFSETEPDAGQYDDPRPILWATGAAIMVRRAAVDAVGLFDENFVMHMEEIDLCWRFYRAEMKVMVEPRSVVYHVGAASLAESNPRKTYLNFRNNLLTLYKNLSPGAWRRTVLSRGILDTLAILRAAAVARPSVAMAIVRAYADAWRMRHQYSDQRPDATTAGLLYRGSIVVDYFLLRRRVFTELPARKMPSFGA
ncbi:MAG: glycosyltransferase family 2 protein, partial [Rhodothermales bacterium]|nr:glycosyltransferase family 2 protein [Rhodothermales bacterium]